VPPNFMTMGPVRGALVPSSVGLDPCRVLISFLQSASSNQSTSLTLRWDPTFLMRLGAEALPPHACVRRRLKALGVPALARSLAPAYRNDLPLSVALSLPPAVPRRASAPRSARRRRPRRGSCCA